MQKADKKNFWKALPHPFFALAPMEDVTDTAFREIVLSASVPGRLHVLYTEFTSIDGLCHPIGKDKVSHRFVINKSELELIKELGIKLVVQIWGSDPEKFFKVAKMLDEEYNFDGIDINMGCPVKKIVKQAACSALIAFPSLAKEIIEATQEATSLPVSVKTRTGIKQHDTVNWISNVLQTRPDALILHARTQKMMSDYPAEWDEIAKAKTLRDEISPNTILVGNGDVSSYQDGLDKFDQYAPDGIMIGRGIFQNPWFFGAEPEQITIDNKLDLLLKHTRLYVETWQNTKSFNLLKRFFKIYINGFRDAANLRAKLMDSSSLSEVEDLIAIFRKVNLQEPI